MDNLIFETNHYKVILAEDQMYFGRCVVMLKRPCGTLAEVIEEEMLDLLKLIQRFESVFKKEYDATMFNYTCLMNGAYKNTPPNPQVHWHFRPRYDKAVIFQGVEFADPNFAHHYNREPKRILEANLQQSIVNDLRSKFSNW